MLIELSHEVQEKLTTSEKVIIDFLNDNATKLTTMSIVDIADLTFTSPATVSRAIRKVGMNGFTELRYRLLNQDKQDSQVLAYQGVNRILEKSLIEVSRTIENIKLRDVVEIVKAIDKAKRIYLFARGLSELVAQEFDAKIKLMGYNAFLISDPNIMVKLAKNIKSDELVIAFSLRGETDSIVDAVRIAKENSVPVVGCCCEKNSTLNSLADIMMIGEKHRDISIKEFEVTSRIPLQVISRVIIDYLIEWGPHAT